MQTPSPVSQRSGNPDRGNGPAREGAAAEPPAGGNRARLCRRRHRRGGTTPGPGTRQGPLSPWGHRAGGGSGAGASRGAPTEPVPLPGTGEAPLSPHLGRRESSGLPAGSPKRRQARLRAPQTARRLLPQLSRWARAARNTLPGRELRKRVLIAFL